MLPPCWVQVDGLVPLSLSVHGWLSQLVIQKVFRVCVDALVFRQHLPVKQVTHLCHLTNKVQPCVAADHGPSDLLETTAYTML